MKEVAKTIDSSVCTFLFDV